MKPVIGITCNYDYKDTLSTASGLGTALQDWDYIAMDYANAVVKAGGIPVIIPNMKEPEAVEELMERLDGVILSGGSDVDPAIYHEDAKACCGTVFTRRDRQEVQVLKFAYAKKLPILGICRGIQFMNAYFGGTLIQDLPSEAQVYHTRSTYMRNEGVHSVLLEADSKLAGIYGTTEIRTNSFHHQAVKDVAENGRVVGKGKDGIVEAMEFTGGHPFMLAVQWHPEMMFDSEEQAKLFTAFIEASRKKL